MNEGAKFINWTKENGYGKVNVSQDALIVFVEYLEHLSNYNNKPLVIPDVMPSLQQDDSEMLFHECPNCNCRCNCSSQPCSCCNEA